MHQLVRLLVSEDHVNVSRSAAAAFAAMLPWLKARQGEPEEPPEVLQASQMLDARGLDALLERTATPAGADLAVEFGLRHTRIGLVPQPPDGAGQGGLEGYIRAWTAQMWNLDPSAYLLRWDSAGNSSLLASLIDRSMMDCVAAFAKRRSLRLTSCKSAILGVLSAVERLSTAGGTVLQWTEPASGAARAGIIQLAYAREGEVMALWRGWVPPTGADGQDQPLEDATERFRAAHNVPVTATVEHAYWQAVYGHALEGACT